ncbi:HdlC: putative heterodisulfide reductase-like protein, subunit C [Desulfobacula toluolica Tol2]|uniref:HdlC: putative heterodisulfide reductase-like protein, subunit C n=2 Tax=Desulfobacula toluolica TaxID=28223 RepID=K0NMM5_DESTT|nr:HdlC: putative heterodisulfide reductase-like protein, subunit C [Desulfobacula toluolica Tol2]
MQELNTKKRGKGMGQENNELLLTHIGPIKEMIQTCIQCGTCTASCPNTKFMDMTPRHMWRLLLTDHADVIFSSKSFIMCSSCYYCTLRCPRGLELTAAMSLLKQAALKLKLKRFRRSSLFYEAFLDSVKKHGRVKEMEFMTHYFMSMKNPLLPLGYAALGTRLLAKGKIRPDFSFGGKGKLTALFEKTAQLEG